jgi:putative glutamine amidotransferase
MAVNYRPMIGLTPLMDIERESYWMLPGYMEALRDAGALPVMLPLTDDPGELRTLADRCDGLLFTGGQDVAPAVYGAEQQTELLGPLCPERDSMDLQLLRIALEKDLPVFGICRGLQLMNAALGGTLWQDLPAQRPGEIVHRMQRPYDGVAHEVILAEDGFLRSLLGRERTGVNSCHHQAIRDLAPCLRAAAVAPDGLVEAVELPGMRCVRAVQWHPEFSWRVNADSRAILESFVERCR